MTKGTSYLTFFIGEDEYGIEISYAREIVAFGDVTRLPGAPEPVRGIMNLRGTVVPVVDLAVKFRLGRCDAGAMTCVILLDLRVGGVMKAIGVIADSVSQVIEVAPGSIEEPPTFGTPVSPEALIGLVRSDSRFILLLDIERVLASLEIDELTNAEPAVADAAAAG